jgi:hypothetical protein
MAISTTTINACDVVVKLANDVGTLVDISGSSNTVQIDLTMNIGDKRVFGSRWPARKECGKDTKVRLDVLYSTASGEAMDLLKQWYFSASPGARELHIYLPTSGVGADEYFGTFVLESMSIPATAGEAEPITVSANLSVSGEFRLTTQAS